MPPPLQTHASSASHRSHNCNETLQKVLLLLDGRLDDADQKILADDIQQCSECLEKLRIEKEFKAFMHARFVKKACTEPLKAQLRNIVQQQIN